MQNTDTNPFYFNDTDIPHPFLFNSSLSIITSSSRLPYFLSSLPTIRTILHSKKLTITHDKCTFTVSTTEHTRDPYILIKARDMLLLISRCVPCESAFKILEDNFFFDIIKITDNENRLKRLVRPETLKALMLLTRTEVFVERKSVCVIGRSCRMVRDVRDCVEKVFEKNVHPSFLLKRMVVRKEVERDEEKKEMDWSGYLPMAKSKMGGKKKKKVEKIKSS